MFLQPFLFEKKLFISQLFFKVIIIISLIFQLNSPGIVGVFFCFFFNKNVTFSSLFFITYFALSKTISTYIFLLSVKRNLQRSTLNQI